MWPGPKLVMYIMSGLHCGHRRPKLNILWPSSTRLEEKITTTNKRSYLQICDGWPDSWRATVAKLPGFHAPLPTWRSVAACETHSWNIQKKIMLEWNKLKNLTRAYGCIIGKYELLANYWQIRNHLYNNFCFTCKYINWM